LPVAEIFWVFLKLGLTSFGGPIAHLGYFREEFVRRRQWLDDAGFAQLLAVCQFLPGPASSQLGFAIGLFRGGWLGALMAFVGFTLPSALLMFGFALLAPHVDGGIGSVVVHGLKLVAVAVVAQGILGMARQLTPDVPRVLIAVVAVVLILLTGNVWMQLVAIALGGTAGLWMCRRVTPPPAATFPVRHGTGVAMLFFVLFLVGLLASLALPAEQSVSMGGLAAAFYRTGALVFGGGHVVLPLLQHTVVESGWVTPDAFLAGYGAAQAMPGPMFSLAAFLGASVPLNASPGLGASIALIAVFLPGFLLLLAVLPVWMRLAARSWAIRVMAGINAAVVGLLVAAFYDPVWTQSIRGFADVAIAAVAFVMLAAFRFSALWAVLWCVVASIALTL
jgi:chromate transporter